MDLKKTPKHPYGPSAKEVAAVNVPPMRDPNASGSCKDAVGAPYAVSYAPKFVPKKGEAAVDYAVMPPACGGRRMRRRSTCRTGTRGSGRR